MSICLYCITPYVHQAVPLFGSYALTYDSNQWLWLCVDTVCAHGWALRALQCLHWNTVYPTHKHTLSHSPNCLAYTETHTPDQTQSASLSERGGELFTAGILECEGFDAQWELLKKSRWRTERQRSRTHKLERYWPSWSHLRLLLLEGPHHMGNRCFSLCLPCPQDWGAVTCPTCWGLFQTIYTCTVNITGLHFIVHQRFVKGLPHRITF